jgi:hypothetical protein
MPDGPSPLVATGHWEERRDYLPRFVSSPLMLFVGDWQAIGEPGGGRRSSSTAHAAFHFAFRGGRIRWRGSKGPDCGEAEVYLDGALCATIDAYAPAPEADAVKFERSGLDPMRLHTLRVVVRGSRHPQASGYRQDVTVVEAEEPVCYALALLEAMNAELGIIRAGAKAIAQPASWRRVGFAADAPERGVGLGEGPLKTLFDRNIDNLLACAESPTLCDGVGWSDWLPASNEGRMLAGAGHALRWGERADLRAIVERLVAGIAARMRSDGYYGYYPEERSFALTAGVDSERKNYDRVFWTRGLLAAGAVGVAQAYRLVRRMHDWLAASPYAKDLLIGANASNGLPGGPLVHLSPAGAEIDLVLALRFQDQAYWREALADANPLAFSDYPGERPHCYLLLGLEAMLDLYRATGAKTYLDAALGGWRAYRDSFKHVGGATAIMESHDHCPPKSYFLTRTAIGETCGGVFWIDVNHRLLRLFPGQEAYAAEIEEQLFNVILAAQDETGRIRYHNLLHGRKRRAARQNACCEVSATGLISRVPELVFSVAADAIFVNLYARATLATRIGDDAVGLAMDTAFPFEPDVRLSLSLARPRAFAIVLRVPSWAIAETAILVNGIEVARGEPGAYVPVARQWQDGDRVALTLPVGLRAAAYEGVEQAPDGSGRFAILYGPVLMALLCDPQGDADMPRLLLGPDDLVARLDRPDRSQLVFRLAEDPRVELRPYWMIERERFTCFPALGTQGVVNSEE